MGRTTSLIKHFGIQTPSTLVESTITEKQRRPTMLEHKWRKRPPRQLKVEYRRLARLTVIDQDVHGAPQGLLPYMNADGN